MNAKIIELIELLEKVTKEIKELLNISCTEIENVNRKNDNITLSDYNIAKRNFRDVIKKVEDLDVRINQTNKAIKIAMENKEK